MPWHGGRHDDCHLYESPLPAGRGARARRTPGAALLVLLALALAGGGFWVLATYGKKVVTAPVESLVQPSWITEAVAYALEARGAARAAAPPERNAELLRQLATLHQEVQAQRAALEALKGGPRSRRTPAAKAAPGPPGPAETARVDALCQSRPQGGDGRAEGQ